MARGRRFVLSSGVSWTRRPKTCVTEFRANVTWQRTRVLTLAPQTQPGKPPTP
jgi:hypothetical protein